MELSEQQPFVSVIIPIRPGGEPRALGPLGKMDYPEDRYEILVSEGRQPSVQRNRAVEEARGEIICFLDDDSMATPGLFREAARRFAENPDVVAVGGPILTPETDGFLQKSFGLAFESVFGGSSIRARYKKLGPERDATENELILANMCFKREAFLMAGGFNERLYPNEENELMNRLQSEGGRFLYVPDLAIYRSQRPSYKAFVRQVFTYGRGRMDQNYAHPEGFRPLHMAPSLFLLYCVSLLVIHNAVYFLPVLLYLILSAAFSVLAAAERRKPLQLFVMPFIFMTLHLGYGAGFLWGVVKGAVARGSGPVGAVEVNVRRVGR